MSLSDRLNRMQKKAYALESKIARITADLDSLLAKGEQDDDVYTANVQFIEVMIKVSRSTVINCLEDELTEATLALETLSLRVSE